jgi:hypothetical protein
MRYYYNDKNTKFKYVTTKRMDLKLSCDGSNPIDMIIKCWEFHQNAMYNQSRPTRILHHRYMLTKRSRKFFIFHFSNGKTTTWGLSV